MSELINKVKSFPETPGVYLMEDSAGSIIYIGKAINLRDRTLSYFGKGRDSRYQLTTLMKKTHDIKIVKTRNEKEALLLEYDLIQKHKPRYNIMYRDDKSFSKIKITVKHTFPGIYITRKALKDGSDYFGPHTSSVSCRETLDLVVTYFKIRTCSDIYFRNRSRPCLQYEIGRCTAPCAGLTNASNYNEQIRSARFFLNGKIADLMNHLKNEMNRASKEMRYEDAAEYRDIISGLKNRTISHRNNLNKTTKPENIDRRQIISKTLQRKLYLTEQPVHIEALDISNISGKHAIGSIVSFINEKPNKAAYRTYKVRTSPEPNDYGMMKEVIERRIRKEPYPDLLLIDGGKGHLMTISRVLKEIGISEIAVVSISKGKKRNKDEIHVLNRKNPVKFRQNDPAYLFIKKMRDEAHRFGIKHYRKNHRKENIMSILDNIKGIGPAKKSLLLRHFGSIDKIVAAAIPELTALPGISQTLAEKIKTCLVPKK